MTKNAESDENYLDAGFEERFANSVTWATNFDKTHNFTLQRWKALYIIVQKMKIGNFRMNFLYNRYFVYVAFFCLAIRSGNWT